MRAAAALLLLADGMPITAVSAMLGHSLTSTTLNNYNYAHVLPGADRLTAEAVERLLGEVQDMIGEPRLASVPSGYWTSCPNQDTILLCAKLAIGNSTPASRRRERPSFTSAMVPAHVRSATIASATSAAAA